MKIDKLSNKQKQVVFITKGSFFCCKSTLVESEQGSFRPVKVTLERISRYSDSDFLKEIEDEKSSVLFVRYPLNESFDGEYIQEEREIPRTNIEVVAQALGGDKILVLGFDFNRISALDMRSSKRFEVEMQMIKHTNVNEVFDPVWYGDKIPPFSSHIDEFLKEFDLHEYDQIVLMGEFCWIGMEKHLVNLLISKGAVNSNIVVDELGVIEALLHAHLGNSALKFLDKQLFESSVTIKNSLKTELEVDDSKRGIRRKIYLESGEGKELILEAHERFSGDELRDTRHLLFRGKGLTEEIERFNKKILMRRDVLNSTEKKSLTLEKLSLRGKGIKVPTDIEISVLQAQKVKIGDVLGVRKKAGGMLKEEIVSKSEGIVDLDFLEYGWVFLKDPKTYQKHISLEHSNVLKIRPREIFGPDRLGILNTNVVYSKRFSIDNYLEQIKEGMEVYIVRTIGLKEYNAIAYDILMTNLCSVVVLEGIDMETKEGFLFENLNNGVVQLDNKRKELLIGLPSKAKFESESADTKEKRAKKGDVIRIIDEKKWGGYARIVDIREQNLICEIDGHQSEISFLNVL